MGRMDYSFFYCENLLIRVYILQVNTKYNQGTILWNLIYEIELGLEEMK